MLTVTSKAMKRYLLCLNISGHNVEQAEKSILVRHWHLWRVNQESMIQELNLPSGLFQIQDFDWLSRLISSIATISSDLTDHSTKTIISWFNMPIFQLLINRFLELYMRG